MSIRFITKLVEFYNDHIYNYGVKQLMDFQGFLKNLALLDTLFSPKDLQIIKAMYLKAVNFNIQSIFLSNFYDIFRKVFMKFFESKNFDISSSTGLVSNYASLDLQRYLENLITVTYDYSNMEGRNEKQFLSDIFMM